MEVLHKNILEHITNYLIIKDLIAFRESNKNNNACTREKYFKRIFINVRAMSNQEIINFVNFSNEHKLCINISNVLNRKRLSYFLNSRLQIIKYDEHFNFNKINDVNFKYPSMLKKIILDTYNINKIYFPQNLKHLQFGYSFDADLKQGMLPPELQSLEFGYRFNHALNENVLPTRLKTLIFGMKYNKEIKQGVLPIGLKTLKFGDSYNQPIEGVLPTGLENLEFGNDFNKEIKPNDLPKNLTKLVFGSRFNQLMDIDFLPKKLKYLRFGATFNQPILYGALPDTIEYLCFCSNFKQELDEFNLPCNLQKLVISESYRNKLFISNKIIIKYYNYMFGQDLF
jgi:hypothetical protein